MTALLGPVNRLVGTEIVSYPNRHGTGCECVCVCVVLVTHAAAVVVFGLIGSFCFVACFHSVINLFIL